MKVFYLVLALVYIAIIWLVVPLVGIDGISNGGYVLLLPVVVYLHVAMFVMILTAFLFVWLASKMACRRNIENRRGMQ